MKKNYDLKIYYKDNRFVLANKREDIAEYKDKYLGGLARVIAGEVGRIKFETNLPSDKLTLLYEVLVKYNKVEE